MSSTSIYVPIEKEYERNSDLNKDDIKALREWYEKQPHLPKITDSELAIFLHSNYYRMEPTKITIDTFYTARTHVPEFFANRDPLGKDLEKCANVVTFLPLDTPTKEGYRVIIGHLLITDPSQFNYNDCMKYFNMIFDLWMYSEGTMQGHILVFDIKGVQFGHAARLNPLGLKKFLIYLQEGLPVRLKGLHYINITPVMDVILNMIKPFMKKELMDMLRLHQNLTTVEEYFPVDSLPNEMGGKAGTLEQLHKAQLKKIKDNRDWFLHEEKNCRVDESCRPGKQKSATDLFGVEGTFKKLDID